MSIKITVIGAAGRMGREIIKSISSNKKCILAGAIESKNSPFLGIDAGVLCGIGEKKVLITDDSEQVIKDCDVTIDFSSPASTNMHIKLNQKYKKPAVIGTTGIEDDNTIKEAAKSIPILFSPNMSVGVNLLFKLTELASNVLNQGYDIEIIEAHHRYKKDAPSGTAKKLLEIILNNLNNRNMKVVNGRNGLLGERDPDEIGLFSIRGGDIVGEHTVMFTTLGERIELTHKAHSRATFANGAVKAAIFIVGKNPGLYSMFDVLGF